MRALVPLQIVCTSIAVCLAIWLWSAGLFVVLGPTSARWSLLATALAAASSLIAAALVRSRRAPAIVGGVLGLAALTAAALFPYAVLRASGSTVESWPGQVTGAAFDRLRVVQLNVNHDYPRLARLDQRATEIAALLEREQADLVVLNEVWHTLDEPNLAHTLATRLGMHAVYARANGSRRLLGFEEGTAILSRYPLRSSERLTLRPNATLFERRIALIAEIALPWGNARVVGTHLHHQRPDVAERQSLDLLEHLRTSGGAASPGRRRLQSDDR